MLITRLIFCGALLTVPGALVMDGANVGAPVRGEGSISVRVTMSDGTIRAAQLNGLGCAASICSRVVIKGVIEGASFMAFRLDSIAAIKNVTYHDVVLELNDGSQRKLSLVTDFRVLYLTEPHGAKRLDFSNIKSLEFVPSIRS